MIKLNEIISLSGRKSVSGRFSIDWTKTFKGIETRHKNKIVYFVIMEENVVIVL